MGFGMNCSCMAIQNPTGSSGGGGGGGGGGGRGGPDSVLRSIAGPSLIGACALVRLSLSDVILSRDIYTTLLSSLLDGTSLRRSLRFLRIAPRGSSDRAPRRYHRVVQSLCRLQRVFSSSRLSRSVTRPLLQSPTHRPFREFGNCRWWRGWWWWCRGMDFSTCSRACCGTRWCCCRQCWLPRPCIFLHPSRHRSLCR
jgi:hypothetical protein